MAGLRGSTLSATASLRHGNALLAIGAIHQTLLFCVPELRTPLLDAASAGLNGVVAGRIGDPPMLDRALSNFFALSGSLMLTLGLLMRCYVQDTGRPLPNCCGWAMIMAAVTFGVLDVATGAPLVLALGIDIVRCAKPGERRDD